MIDHELYDLHVEMVAWLALDLAINGKSLDDQLGSGTAREALSTPQMQEVYKFLGKVINIETLLRGMR